MVKDDESVRIDEMGVLLFFSSRRRHTRFDCDWSSDVCSSDLSGRGTANFGAINGQRVTEEEFVNAQREVYWRYFFMTGNWPDQDAKRTGFDPQRETYQWLMVIQKEEQMGVHVSSDVAAQVAREMIRSLERMNVRSTDMFFNDVLKP